MATAGQQRRRAHTADRGRSRRGGCSQSGRSDPRVCLTLSSLYIVASPLKFSSATKPVTSLLLIRILHPEPGRGHHGGPPPRDPRAVPRAVQQHPAGHPGKQSLPRAFGFRRGERWVPPAELGLGLVLLCAQLSPPCAAFQWPSLCGTGHSQHF